MKDNFSVQASYYAQFRPVYPPELYDYVLNLVRSKNIAWDCGCGNGQVASVLSNHFGQIIATDISSKQIEYAVQKPNIDYRLMPAETTDITSHTVDLITVAQAIHWFDINKFVDEVKRVSKPGAILAVWCYNLLEINPELDRVVNHLYEHILGNEYWDPERKLIEQHYKTIPFPFEEISSPEFRIEVSWNLDQLVGYLNSWSAVQHYIRKNGTNPIDGLQKQLIEAWGSAGIRQIRFPIYTRMGKVSV